MNNTNKYIYLDVVGRTHSLYNNLINYPPDGYKFIHHESIWDTFSEKVARNHILDSLHGKMNRVIPVNTMKSYVDKVKHKPTNAELTYSSGHLIFRNEPWIVDLEFVTHLAGYYRVHFNNNLKLIQKLLRSNCCKKIIPWTDMGTKTVKKAFDDLHILEKVETVHLAVPPKKFLKQYNDKMIKLLFIGSQNLLYDFEIKGGKEVLAAFSKIEKSYDNVELVIRSYVPPRLKNKYQELKHLTIIDQVVPWQQLEHEFTSSDIFLFPSHNTPGLAILDAMSYELPVITTDLWANSEMIQNGRNGILITPPKEINYFGEDLIPRWGDPDFLKLIRKYSINEEPLVTAICNLIDHPELRKRMGQEGRRDIEYGEFSITKRNERLKKIFDSIIKN